MKLSNKENKIKDLFQNDEFPLNVDAFWDELEPKLEKKKKRRFIFWFLIGGLLLGYGAAQFGSSDTIEIASSEVSKVNANIVEKDDDCLESEFSEVAIDSKNSVTKEIVEVTPIKKESQKEGLSSPILYSGIEKLSMNGIQLEKENIKTEVKTKNKIVQKILPRRNSEIINSKLNIINTGFLTNSVNSNQFSVKKPIYTKAKVADPLKIISKEERMRLQKAKKKQRMAMIAAKKKAAKQRKRKRQFKRNIKKIKKIFNPWSTELDVAYGIEYAVKIMKADFPKFEPLITKRKKEETMLETQFFGINMNHKHKNGFVFEYGIDYRQMTQLYEFSSYKEREYQKKGVTEVVEDNFGNTIRESYGMKTIHETIKINRHIYKRQYMVNVPLSIGYFKMKRKYYFEILGGVDINVFVKRPDPIIFAEAIYDTPFKGSHPVFYSKTGIGLSGSFKIARKITKRLTIYGAPYFKVNLRPITTLNYGLYEKYHFVGLHLGLKMNLYQ